MSLIEAAYQAAIDDMTSSLAINALISPDSLHRVDKMERLVWKNGFVTGRHDRIDPLRFGRRFNPQKPSGRVKEFEVFLRNFLLGATSGYTGLRTWKHNTRRTPLLITPGMPPRRTLSAGGVSRHHTTVVSEPERSWWIARVASLKGDVV